MNVDRPSPKPDAPQPGKAGPRRGAAKLAYGGLALVVVAAILVAIRSGAGRRGPAEQRVPTVAVATAQRRDLYQEVSIQAEFRPYQQVELFAKVAGYMKTINVDFGDRVRAGDPIATIEVPELQDELDHAIAAEQRAEADYREAHLDYTRLSGVNRSQPNLVAQQDLDDAEARDGAAAAAVAAVKADVEKYQTLFAYTRITAPFDGVITARSADPGAMIQAASSSATQALPIVRLSENQLLRLDFAVSVSYAQDMRVGDPVDITLEGSGRRLRANITRFTREVALATRTMETEVEVPNPDLALIPGMYATVTLKLNRRPDAVSVPVEAVSGGNNPTLYVVDANDTIAERPVKIGIETASYDEILSGVRPGEVVVIGSRAGVQPGAKVAPKETESASLP